MPITMSPRAYLATEQGRLRNTLTNLQSILNGESPEAFETGMDLWAADVVADLEHSVARVKRAITALEAERAIKRCEATDQARAA